MVGRHVDEHHDVGAGADPVGAGVVADDEVVGAAAGRLRHGVAVGVERAGPRPAAALAFLTLLVTIWLSQTR